jgi:SAM-dependent methyltransferase
MVTRPAWAPPDVDLDRPSAARVYDYLLGGSHNFAVDREVAEGVLRFAPDARAAAHANRAFLHRAVAYLVSAGVRQFLDLGSGIPTLGNVHEVARGAAPDARVVYVDIDPVAVAHSRALIGESADVAVIHADVREPRLILDDPDLHELIDFSRPVGLLMVALLHFIPDSDRPAEIIARFRDALAPGSHLVISQVGSGPVSAPGQEAHDRYVRAAPVTLRSRGEVTAFFDGFELVEPGLVEPAEWRPESPELVRYFQDIPTLAGVGIKHS